MAVSTQASSSVHPRILNHLPQPPPRILHSDAHPTLDPLILDLISLICREHILTWYSAISRDPDRAFINQVSAILIHVVQALEVRLAHVDLVELVVLDLPALLERHVRDFDDAEDKARTGHAHNLDRDNVFHLLQPHLAIGLVPFPATGVVEPVVDKSYLRALVTNLLVLLLPPEDCRAETERAIVREIIVNVVFGSLVGRVAQPWFLHMMIGKVLERQEGGQPVHRTDEQNPPPTSPITSKQALGSAQAVLHHGLSVLSKIAPLFRAVTASVSALYHTATASPVPAHYAGVSPLSAPTLSFIQTLLPPSPLLSQTLHYINLPLSLASSFITSLMFYIFNEKVFTPNLTQSLLELATRALFPNGHPPPKEPDPNLEEREELRIRCEELVAAVLPGKLQLFVTVLPSTLIFSCRNLVILAKITLPPSIPDRSIALSQHLLRPISSHIANVHLFIVLIDLVVGKVFPELLVRPED